MSLAATRAAKSCSAGQQKLATAPRSAAPAPARTVPVQPVWPPAAPSQAVRTTKAPPARKAKAPEVDSAKDQLLVNAFADAIKQAAAPMGGGA